MLNKEEVIIWREPDGDYHIEWQASHPDTEVTVEPLTESAGVQTHRAEHSNRLRMSGLAPRNRHFFRVRDQHGTEVLAAERNLGMQGTPNFRDFGGYATADGRRVKWGYLFRSGQLSRLSDQDVELLASLELDLVCDFRRLEEQQSDPSKFPAHRPPKVASLPIIPGSNARFFEEAENRSAGRQAMFDFMLEINRDFVLSQAPNYACMFREILDLENARFLVHCAAGKDRTGFAAAIILLALGVPREVVLRDYMLTERYFHPRQQLERIRRKYKMETLDADAILPMLEVHAAYLECALTTIEQSFPSIERYLEDALGVGEAELAELKARYLA